MRSLTLKIFISYWIAAAVVIVGFNILGSPMHRPEYSRALETVLAMTAAKTAAEYETSGCPVSSDALRSAGTTFYLAKPTGEQLCGMPDGRHVKEFVVQAAATGTLSRKRRVNEELFAIATRSASGTAYVFLMQEPYAQPGKIFGLLTPSYTTIAISGVCTLLLAFLLTRPIRRLRWAARQIASGKLETRVEWGNPKTGETKQLGGIDGLIQDFNYMADRLQTLVSSQRMLLRDVSHELRSPLARLRVALELVRERPESEQEKHLERIEREADRINTMLGELLSLSHLETIETVARPEDVCLNQTLLELSMDATYEAQKVNRQVRCHLAEECSVLGDSLLLRRGFENVIRNAVHYCPEGGMIDIKMNMELRGTAKLAVVRISDNGPGVPEEEIDLILQPFYRADRARRQIAGGYGLGLSIAARAIRLHSGTIIARNQPQGGLMVEIAIPSL